MDAVIIILAAVSFPFWSYLIVRLSTAAYFKSREWYEKHRTETETRR